MPLLSIILYLTHTNHSWSIMNCMPDFDIIWRFIGPSKVTPTVHASVNRLFWDQVFAWYKLWTKSLQWNLSSLLYHLALHFHKISLLCYFLQSRQSLKIEQQVRLYSLTLIWTSYWTRLQIFDCYRQNQNNQTHTCLRLCYLVILAVVSTQWQQKNVWM